MSGLTPLSQTKFSPEMNSKPGISSKKSKFGVEWKGIDLKPEWKPQSTDSNPSPQAADPKGDGLLQNAQSPSRKEKTSFNSAFGTNPSPNDPTDNGDGLSPTKHRAKIDSSTPSNVDGNEDESKGNSVKFPGMKKRVCCLCGHKSTFDLTPYSNPAKGINGYICVRCHMEGPPSEPEKADSQTKLEAGA
jgi:hypothetical protein